MKSWQDNFSELIREGELALCGLRIVSFLNAEGEKRFRFRWGGDAEVPELIGILELLKSELIAKSLEYGAWDH